MKIDGEYCRHCGRPYTQVYHVPDDLWRRVATVWQLGTLCIECFDFLAQSIGVFPYWTCGDGSFDKHDSEIVNEEKWISDTVLELERDCGECSHMGAVKEDVLRRRLPLLNRTGTSACYRPALECRRR